MISSEAGGDRLYAWEQIEKNPSVRDHLQSVWSVGDGKPQSKDKGSYLSWEIRTLLGDFFCPHNDPDQDLFKEPSGEVEKSAAQEELKTLATHLARAHSKGPQKSLVSEWYKNVKHHAVEAYKDIAVRYKKEKQYVSTALAAVPSTPAPIPKEAPPSKPNDVVEEEQSRPSKEPQTVPPLPSDNSLLPPGLAEEEEPKPLHPMDQEPAPQIPDQELVGYRSQRRARVDQVWEPSRTSQQKVTVAGPSLFGGLLAITSSIPTSSHLRSPNTGRFAKDSKRPLLSFATDDDDAMRQLANSLVNRRNKTGRWEMEEDDSEETAVREELLLASTDPSAAPSQSTYSKRAKFEDQPPQEKEVTLDDLFNSLSKTPQPVDAV